MKRFISKQPLKNIIIIFLLPLLLSGTLYLFSSYQSVSSSKANINVQFTNQLYDFVELNKKLTNNVFQDFLNVASFAPITNILCADSAPKKYDSSVSDAQSVLKLYMQNNPIVSGICLINRYSDFVVTENEVYQFQSFFDLNCKYSKYDFEYWTNLRVKPNSPKLLDSGEVVVEGKNKVIIPYICTVPNTIGNSSFIIVNLDLEYVFNMLKSYGYTPNAKVFLMNNNSYRCLSTDGMIDLPFKDKNLVYDLLNENFSTYSDVVMNGVKYYVMAASSTNSLYNYSYIVCVPNYDIANSTSSERTAFIITLMLETIILVLAFLVFIVNIYKPLRYISLLTSDKNIENNNVLKNIINYIRTSADNISSLECTLNELLPASIQNYLYNLSKKNALRDTAFEKIAFKYDYFLPLSFEIIFKQKFYEDINMPYLSAQAIDVINTQFEINFHTYCISKSTTTLSILLNLQSENEASQVNETIKTTMALFSADNIYLSIYIGIGTVITDLSCLPESVKQCTEHIHSALVEERKNIANAAAIFGHKESIQLENYLTNANIDAALDLIKNIDNRLLSTPRDIVSTVYIDILFSVHRIMKLKGINPQIQGDSLGFDYISEISQKSQSDLYDYTVACIEQIGSVLNNSGNMFNIEDAIEYIRRHFTEDLSLDILAEKCHTSPQYLSKRIKQYLGFTFLDYLSSLRVEKAKELLSTTAKGINEISEESGFISRNTFLRVFKKYTGVPPSEYRKNLKTTTEL